MSFCLSYLSEHLKENKSFKIALYKNHSIDSKIITMKIKSCHTSSREYRVFICYSPCNQTEINRSDLIKGNSCYHYIRLF